MTELFFDATYNDKADYIRIRRWAMARLKGSSTIGALSSMSKNTGDGKWCEQCRARGFYSWLSLINVVRRNGTCREIYDSCEVHGYEGDCF
jgi:hypothetical protein